MKSTPLISEYGEMWARNAKNITSILGSKQGGQGVYILYDGSVPMYFGMGNIRSRLRAHRRSMRKKEFWDRFSWYLIEPRYIHDVESLLLRMSPHFLRSLNKKGGKFTGAKLNRKGEDHPVPETISRKFSP